MLRKVLNMSMMTEKLVKLSQRERGRESSDNLKFENYQSFKVRMENIDGFFLCG